MSPLVEAARDIAGRAHHGQTRKALGLSYFSHLQAVADMLVAHGYTDDVTLAAAYLHDVAEDQPAFVDEMVQAMPREVVETVYALTEPKRDGSGVKLPKAARFDAYVRGLAAGTPAARRALPISCADKIHNTASILEAEAAGEHLIVSLKTRPGEHRGQLGRLRELYASAVRPSLLGAFDEAANRLLDFVDAWFPGRAAQIAAEAHLGQLDKAGEPYIFHPMRLATEATGRPDRTAALLHDVVEDSPWTLDALEREGCPEAVLRAVDALTRRPGETYDDFITRVARDRVATRVKLLDLSHNADLNRIASPTDADRARVAKYRDVMVRLRSELDKRSLQVTLTDDSVREARSFARLAVPRADHVTLVHRIHPEALELRFVPGGHEVGDVVEVRAVAEVEDERVQAFIVEMGGTRVRPSDGGLLHLTVSRARTGRSCDANDLLERAGGAAARMEPLRLEGVVEWAD